MEWGGGRGGPETGTVAKKYELKEAVELKRR